MDLVWDRFDVVNTIGRYAGGRRNEWPLTLQEAEKLSREGDQRGRPMIRRIPTDELIHRAKVERHAESPSVELPRSGR